MSHNFTTVALPCLRRSDRAEAHVRARIIPLVIRDATKLTLCAVLSRYFPFPCQYPYINTTYSHYNHPHTTQSHNSAPYLTKTSVCVYLKNINKEPSQQVGVLYTESSGLVSGLNICTSLRGERRNLYIIRTF